MGFNIEILGVNDFGQSSYNYMITPLASLPWLQDTVEQLVWFRWNVTYRDVWVLDPLNRRAAVYNLTTRDLSLPANREALKSLFIQAAQRVDSDNDGLLDAWEEQYFGALTRDGAEDSDGDNVPNSVEFAFASNPMVASSKPVLHISSQDSGGAGRQLSLSFRHQIAGLASYVVESSSDLKQWSEVTTGLGASQTVNTFDGTGAATATIPLSAPLGNERFFRARAVMR